MPKIMKIGWQLTKLLPKLSGLLFLAHPVIKQAAHGYSRHSETLP